MNTLSPGTKALHEAGHACLHDALGTLIHSVSIGITEDDNGECVAEQTSNFNWVVALYGGYWAQLLFSDQPELAAAASAKDFEDLDDTLHIAPPFQSVQVMLLYELRAWAKHLVLEREEQIRITADYLVEHGHL